MDSAGIPPAGTMASGVRRNDEEEKKFHTSMTNP
jgi:hypothetical protein